MSHLKSKHPSKHGVPATITSKNFLHYLAERQHAHSAAGAAVGLTGVFIMSPEFRAALNAVIPGAAETLAVAATGLSVASCVLSSITIAKSTPQIAKHVARRSMKIVSDIGQSSTSKITIGGLLAAMWMSTRRAASEGWADFIQPIKDGFRDSRQEDVQLTKSAQDLMSFVSYLMVGEKGEKGSRAGLALYGGIAKTVGVKAATLTSMAHILTGGSSSALTLAAAGASVGCFALGKIASASLEVVEKIKNREGTEGTLLELISDYVSLGGEMAPVLAPIESKMRAAVDAAAGSIANHSAIAAQLKHGIQYIDTLVQMGQDKTVACDKYLKAFASDIHAAQQKALLAFNSSIDAVKGGLENLSQHDPRLTKELMEELGDKLNEQAIDKADEIIKEKLENYVLYGEQPIEQKSTRLLVTRRTIGLLVGKLVDLGPRAVEKIVDLPLLQPQNMGVLQLQQCAKGNSYPSLGVRLKKDKKRHSWH